MGVKQENIESLMEKRFLDYAMSVIMDRAIPSVFDGCKPVQRRLLWAMHKAGAHSNKSTKKCAMIVGETIGKYHPHGDAAAYQALVRMAQQWVLREPLVHPQGNFGSIDNPGAFAASRYTEAKLSKISELMLQDIEKGIVPLIDNYSNELKEPEVLPAKFPNLLVNGAKSIAVGMATDIPSHNLGELVNALCAYIDDESLTVESLMKYLPGPDFPTGGTIRGRMGLREMYKTGKGKFQILAKIEEVKIKNKVALRISEVPFRSGKAKIIDEIKSYMQLDPKNPSRPVIEGIDKVIDESGRGKGKKKKKIDKARDFELMVYLKSTASPEVIKNQIYKYTSAQVAYNANWVALDEKIRPQTFTLLTMFGKFLGFRRDCLTKKLEYDLKRHKDRKHILDGYIKVLEDIDKAVKIIKNSKSKEIAKEALKVTFSLSDIQADEVLDMRLKQLTGLEIEKIKEELASIEKEITRIEAILADQKLLDAEIKKELNEIKEKFSSERRSKIVNAEITEFDIEDLIEDENCIVTTSNKGYINRVPVDSYRVQRRGGKGSTGVSVIEDDFIEDVFKVTSLSHLLCFSNQGQVHWLKAYQIPIRNKGTKGKPIVNYLTGLKPEEQIQAILAVDELSAENDDKFVFFITRKGMVKKTRLSNYSNPRRGGVKALKLKDGDELLRVLLVDDNKEIFFGTKNGFGVRIGVDSFNEVGRQAGTVRGIRIRANDEVIGAVVSDDSRDLLTITTKGLGKKSAFTEYRQQNRGGVGSRMLNLSNEDYVVGILGLAELDQVMALSERGQSILFENNSVRKTKRVTKGVKIFNLSDGDRLQNVACIRKVDEELELELETSK